MAARVRSINQLRRVHEESEMNSARNEERKSLVKEEEIHDLSPQQIGQQTSSVNRRMVSINSL